MRSNPAPIIAAAILIFFAGAAYYYWQGGGKSEAVVTGVVIEKSRRAAGSEADGKPLQQGLRVLSGQSTAQEVFYFFRLKTAPGDEIEIEVTEDDFAKIREGDTVQQVTPGTAPAIVKRAKRR